MVVYSYLYYILLCMFSHFVSWQLCYVNATQIKIWFTSLVNRCHNSESTSCQRNCCLRKGTGCIHRPTSIICFCYQCFLKWSLRVFKFQATCVTVQMVTLSPGVCCQNFNYEFARSIVSCKICYKPTFQNGKWLKAKCAYSVVSHRAEFTSRALD
jgi:hypothetical protein